MIGEDWHSTAHLSWYRSRRENECTPEHTFIFAKVKFFFPCFFFLICSPFPFFFFFSLKSHFSIPGVQFPFSLEKELSNQNVESVSMAHYFASFLLFFFFSPFSIFFWVLFKLPPIFCLFYFSCKWFPSSFRGREKRLDVISKSIFLVCWLQV